MKVFNLRKIEIDENGEINFKTDVFSTREKAIKSVLNFYEEEMIDGEPVFKEDMDRLKNINKSFEEGNVYLDRSLLYHIDWIIIEIEVK